MTLSPLDLLLHAIGACYVARYWVATGRPWDKTPQGDLVSLRSFREAWADLTRSDLDLYHERQEWAAWFVQETIPSEEDEEEALAGNRAVMLTPARIGEYIPADMAEWLLVRAAISNHRDRGDLLPEEIQALREWAAAHPKASEWERFAWPLP